MSLKRVAVLASAAVTLALGVSGCSEDAAKPKPLPSSSASTSKSPLGEPPPIPGKKAPQRPDAAKGRNPSAAVNFVRYWVAVLNYSAAAGETSTLRKISNAQCVQCLAISSFIDEVYERGGAIRGKGWTVRHLEIEGGSADSAYRVRASVLVNPQRVRAKSGEHVTMYKGGTREKYFRLAPDGDSWLVYRLDQPE